MIKWLFVLLIVVPLSSWSAPRDTDKVGHIVLSAGNLLSFYGVRLGSKDWEFGLLQYSHFGLVKLEKISKEGFLSFGPTLSIYDSTLGFYASIGLEFIDLTYFNFRIEAYGVSSIKNSTEAGALVSGVISL